VLAPPLGPARPTAQEHGWLFTRAIPAARSGASSPLSVAAAEEWRRAAHRVRGAAIST